MNAIKRHQYKKALDDLLVMGVQTIPQSVIYTDYETVLAVQKALVARGYSVGKSGTDGKFGPDTSSAIKKMQKDAGIPQTGVIDYGVLIALQVNAPSSAPTRSTPGSSASAARKDVQAITDNAAKAADDAETAEELRNAAAKSAAAADAALPPPPPEVKAKVEAAKKQAQSASTPAQVAAAKENLQEANAALQAVVGKPGWYNTPVLGFPLWQVLLGGVGLTAVGIGIYGVMKK